jgi:hypothetical protein
MKGDVNLVYSNGSFPAIIRLPSQPAGGEPGGGLGPVHSKFFYCLLYFLLEVIL